MSLKKLALLAMCATAVMSCSSAKLSSVSGKNALQATCEPQKLEIRNGKVDANVTLVFPAGFMNKTSMVVVTPALIYDGGKALAQPTLFQGESIKSNYKVVPTSGASYTIPVSFDYVAGIEQSFLELHLVLVSGQKKVDLPSIKVADGCNFTYTLANLNGTLNYKADGYVQTKQFEAESTINYDVNSSTVRNNYATRSAIAQYRQQIADFKKDDSYTITGTEIVAYASPEGEVDLNSDLSDERAKAAVRALKAYSASAAPKSIVVKGLGEDWEGFKEAVELSDIQDKNLILRLLEMYDDPVEREAEIRNLSEIFEELKTEVFPLLRRATYVVKADKQGRTDEEISALAATSISSLTDSELMRAATLAEDLKTKEYYYRTALQKFHSTEAAYNMALVSLFEDKAVVAQTYLNTLSKADPDVQNALGVIALRDGKTQEALDHFLAAGDNNDAKLNAGAAYIALGDYAKALDCLKGSNTFNEALALTLCGKLDEADALLGTQCPKAAYLKAVIAARKNDKAAAAEYLKIASSDENLKNRAIKDVEFVDFK